MVFVIKIKWFILLVPLLLFLPASFAADEEWTGDYSYSASYGKTYGGSAIIQEYTVRIRAEQPTCEIEIVGFQVLEEIICSTKVKGSSLVLLFQRYKSGEVKNAYGVQIYRVGQPLMTFERATKNGRRVLLTHWGGITGADGKRLRDGEKFELVRKQ